MFISADTTVAVDFGTASTRLADLARGDGLHQDSGDLYDSAVERLVRVGPAGSVPGISKLVRVRFTDPVRRPGELAVGLRWEATGAAGKLFPALDADIRLIADGHAGTQLVVTGSYRPPFGMVGAEIDRRVLHGVADATIKQLLRQVARRLTDVPEP
ncbi:MAG TPA: hypothetical protein VKU39_20095 [Streptosporangiaceae bacterium]|nr:hypothetical protein [Streptosporangiaceae bacterium]